MLHFSAEFPGWNPDEDTYWEPEPCDCEICRGVATVWGNDPAMMSVYRAFERASDLTSHEITIEWMKVELDGTITFASKLPAGFHTVKLEWRPLETLEQRVYDWLKAQLEAPDERS